MPKRFNNLDAALKYLNPRGTDGDSTSEAPTGSQLRYYQDWKSGKRAVEYGDRDAGSRPGDLQRVAIKPFGFEAASTAEYIVDLSTRADNSLTSAGVTLTLLGVSKTLTDATFTSNFRPAKVTVAVVGTTSTPEESKLTGRKYKKKSASSYTYPLGRTTAEPSYAGAIAAISAAAEAGNRVISFSSEKFS